jgi:hypothetical protein
MAIDINLHDLYQDDGDTTNEEGIDLEPGMNKEAGINDNDDDDI